MQAWQRRLAQKGGVSRVLLMVELGDSCAEGILPLILTACRILPWACRSCGLVGMAQLGCQQGWRPMPKHGRYLCLATAPGSPFRHQLE